MEKEPRFELNKQPLEKRMEALRKRGFHVDQYKDNEWTQCQICDKQAGWYVEGNSYCNECMSEKVGEFEQSADEIDKKVNNNKK